MRIIPVILALLILAPAPALAMRTMEPTPKSIAADAREKQAKSSKDNQAPAQAAPDKSGKDGGTLIIRTAPDGKQSKPPKHRE